MTFAAAPTMSLQDQTTIFNALPPNEGVSYLVLIIVICFCLGAAGTELGNHLKYDVRLVRKPGWKNPAKVASRMAYLICHYSSVIVLTLVLCFTVLKARNCSTLPWVFNTVALFLLDAVSAIFYLRTLALYTGKRKVQLYLSVHFALTLATSVFCVPFYGVGYQIPNSEFCGYDTRRHSRRTIAANIIYKSFAMSLDFSMLMLTLHRLLEGGLGSLWYKTPSELWSDIRKTSLSSFLIRQGFHFYVYQYGCDLLTLALYFSCTQVAYQDLGSVIGFCIPPIVACKAFRDMAKEAVLIGSHNALKINHIDDGKPTGGSTHCQTIGSMAVRESALSPNTLSPLSSKKHLSMATNSYVLQALPTLAKDPEVPTADVPRSAPFGSRWSSLHRQASGSDGIVVSQSTESRIDQLDADWVQAPRRSSDLAGPEPMANRRFWSTSTSSHNLALSSEPIEALPSLPPVVDDSTTGGADAASDAWYPHTPEGAPPQPLPQVLLPSSFSRPPRSQSRDS